MNDLHQYCLERAQRAKRAAEDLAATPGAVKDRWLHRSAKQLVERSVALTEANRLDLAAAPGFGLSDAAVDRLRLTPQRIADMAKAIAEIAALPEPIGQILSNSIRPNGIDVQKVRVPLGVIFFIYESRPNVTADAAALCVKAGNAVILRGGKEAFHSNAAITEILAEAAADAGLPANAVQQVATTDRAAVGHLLKMPEYIDLCIPRGGESLIRRVSEEAKMPVLKHFAGNCHVYLDRSADAGHGREDRRQRQVPADGRVQRGRIAGGPLRGRRVAIAAGRQGAAGSRNRDSRRPANAKILPAAKPATDEDFAAEYLGPIISCKVVDSLDEAIAHINRYSSQHTEAIVTRDLDAARQFAARIDSSAVMINASTRLNDGGEFGLGAEIGISTDKFHARGPCGINELTSYKYVVYGTGQVRE